MLAYYLREIGDEAGRSKFERLYRRWRGLMFHVARKILPCDQDAEDAVHQAFLSALEHLDRIGDPEGAAAKGFVVTITERKALDILRSRLSDAAFDETAQGIEIPPPGTSDLADALARLPARYREVLLLRYHDGYTNRELGKMLGIRPGSVQRLLWRAKASLRDILGEEGTRG